jgi:hypothetical protein
MTYDFFGIRPSFHTRAILSASNRNKAKQTTKGSYGSSRVMWITELNCITHWACGSRTAVAVRVVWSDCRTVDVACRHEWKLRLHFIFYYMMRHESYGRHSTDVAVCGHALTITDEPLKPGCQQPKAVRNFKIMYAKSKVDWICTGAYYALKSITKWYKYHSLVHRACVQFAIQIESFEGSRF